MNLEAVRHYTYLDFMSGAAKAPANADYFNSNAKRVYDKVAQENLMRHNEIYAQLHRELKKFGDAPIAILDIGCSTAERMSRELHASGIRIDRYHGVDISPASIQEARKNSSVLNGDRHFWTGDFRQQAGSLPDNKYDLIWSSYCMHHEKTPEDKEAFLRACRDKLSTKANAAIIITDLICQENESVEQSRERFINKAFDVWMPVFQNEPELVNEVKRHIYNSDYPIKISELRKSAAKLGLKVEELEGPSQDPYFSSFYRMLRITRP